MALPTHRKDETLDKVFQNVLRDAARARGMAKGMSDDIGAGRDVQVRIITHLYEDLWSILGRMPGYRATTGIAVYVEEHWDGDPALNATVEFDAMETAIAAFLTIVDNNIDKSANGYIEERKIEADGSLTWHTKTAVELATFKTKLDDLIATIAL